MDRRRILLVVAVLVAALGAGLVFLYAQDAEDRAAEQVEQVQVLVATQKILPGETASDAFNANKLLSTFLPADAVLEGATNRGEDFADAIALTTIYPGEQLLTQKFGTVEEIEVGAQLPIPKGLAGYPVNLDDISRISGYTQPGSRVGAIITGTFPPSTEVESRLLLDEVNIFATGPQTITQPPPAATNPDGTPVPPPTAIAPINQYIIAVEPRDTLRLEVAKQFGKIQLVLLSAGSKLKVGDPVTADDLFTEDES